MIVTFKDAGTKDIDEGVSTKAARRTCPPDLWPVARRKLDYIHSATGLEDLRMPPGNRLHKLGGDRDGQHAIRINDQYRVCFRWTAQGAAAVEIVDYH
jgi:toxin HigB-1